MCDNDNVEDFNLYKQEVPLLFSIQNQNSQHIHEPDKPKYSINKEDLFKVLAKGYNSIMSHRFDWKSRQRCMCEPVELPGSWWGRWPRTRSSQGYRGQQCQAPSCCSWWLQRSAPGMCALSWWEAEAWRADFAILHFTFSVKINVSK